MAKQVLVICGTGVATSTVVATKIKEHCAANGVSVDVRQGKVMDLLNGQSSADLIVATTQVPAGVAVPTISGLPFLTGMGLEKTLDDIVAALRD